MYDLRMYDLQIYWVIWADLIIFRLHPITQIVHPPEGRKSYINRTS